MVNALHVAEKDKYSSIGGQLSKWMDQVLGPNFQHYRKTDAWQPAINLCEHDTYYCVIVDLAGVKASEIDLRAEEGILILEGERLMPGDTEPQSRVRVHLMEIDHGRFQRAVQLPENVNVDAIEAFYRNGYLWIRIPKTT